jgi:hypothetical protein
MKEQSYIIKEGVTQLEFLSKSKNLIKLIIDEEIKLLVHACCETLLRYKHLSVSDTIMDGNFLATGEFEVMLSKGLGQYFANNEKGRLFQNAKNISDLLAVIMDRRTQELSL